MADPTSRHAQPVDAVLAKLTRVKSAGAGAWMARCPSHEDNTASLSLKAGRDGRVLMKCHASCTNESIVAAIGLTMSALFAPGTARASTTPLAIVSQPTTRTTAMVKSYDYTDEDGNLLYQACRFVDGESGKKTFRQRRLLDGGKVEWNLGDVRLVLYRLPDVLAAVESGKRVFFVEGEKDADTLAGLGYPATTSPMGAGKWREFYAESLKGADVVILPDNDEPGKSHAEQVAASLTAIGCTVRVVELPNLPPKGDVTDWLDAGGDLDALEQIIGATNRWTGDALQAAHRTRWRLDELLDNDSIMRPPPAIVPRLAWSGRSTLLAAREKAGKSTLTGYMTAAVSRGAMFLGEPCAKGDVLVIGLEEFIGDTARRLRHFDADASKVHLVDRFSGEPGMRAVELRQHVEAVAPLLVVIDSLTAYGQGVVTDDNNASQMASVVQPLTDVVHQLGIALVIIHHSTKASGKYRGSTAIGGGVDMLCEFDIPNEETDPTLRRIKSVGRLPVPRVYDIRFNGETYSLATATEVPIDERIIAIVQDRPSCTANDVAEAIDLRRQDVLSRVAALLANGRLMNIGRYAKNPKLVVPGHPLSLVGA